MFLKNLWNSRCFCMGEAGEDSDEWPVTGGVVA
jgi:hypothetical protein